MPQTYKQLNRETGRYETKPWNPFPDHVRTEKNTERKPHQGAAGVVREKGKYKAYIFKNGRQITIGRFGTQEEAIQARQKEFSKKHSN